ncbi:MAG TPA: hypothetical protein PKG88_03145 [Bacteroidales bacterium]|jgi:hypothetical protein|nr:hypothetical protein [Bacteroidales bacterium]HPS71355.1 hypothetical protein [Bacteroidales bacterium]
MEEISKDLGLLAKEATLYVTTNYTLLKLKMILKISVFASSLFNIIITGLFICTIFMFLSIGLSNWIGELLGKTYYGYFVLGGFYFILLFVFKLFFYTIIKKKIQNNIIKKIL